MKYKGKHYWHGGFTIGRYWLWLDLDWRYWGCGAGFNIFGERSIDFGLPCIRFGVTW